MKSRKLWFGILLLGSFGFLLHVSTLVKAQDADDQTQDQDQSPDQDPPGRVARLNFMQGSVSFRPAGEDDWVTAVANRPMVTGDDLWTDEESRAEVHVGSAAIRMSAKTGITFLALDDHATQIRLAQGSIILRVRHVDDDDAYEVDTPNLAFSLLQPGEYRVDVSEDGTQTVADVWHGRGRVTGGGYTYTVIAGQSATFTGNQDHVDYDLSQIPRSDDFDAWAFDRDGHEDGADSANYVSREMTGYEDLDDNGDWSYVAGYGPCWRPRVMAAGWAPYRFGHWAYVGPWGWTWVEDERWGFAPFHYGRWAFVNNGWFWVPGPVVVRPVWAPALVGFVGGGASFRFSAGVGVGWFPLAPGEVYLPGYRVSRAYVNNVNLTNTSVNITEVTKIYNTVIVKHSTTINNVTYVNQHVNNGVTVVSHDTFVNARPVAGNVMRVDAHELAVAPVTHVVAAEPIRSSVTGAGHPVSVRPPAAVVTRAVVAVRTPPPPPWPIEQRQAQAGGHLNEHENQRVLVRPIGAAQPAVANQVGYQNGSAQPSSSGNQQGFRPFTPQSSSNGNSQVRQMPQTQPRTYEMQGSSQPEERNPQPRENRATQPASGFHPPQSQQTQPPVQSTHPLVRPAPPVQERNPQQEQQQEQKFNQWHEARPAPAPRPTPAPKASEAPKPAKKGH
ncbi:MAG TPA: DUF6600 domain-containing protein [Candidatus Sulfotelmatobacter sp.]|jgi:hypothetical protein